MALEAPLRSSTGSMPGLMAPDRPLSPPDTVFRKHVSMSALPANHHDSLSPRNAHLRANPTQMLSPISDIVGPSPVTSNGTETTEIEDDELADASHGGQSQLRMLHTNLPSHIRQSSSEETVSVIHAPQSFHTWMTGNGNSNGNSAGENEQSGSRTPPLAAEQIPESSPAPPPISTNVKPVGYSGEAATPQAQNLQEVIREGNRLRSTSVGALANIPEHQEDDPEDHDDGYGDLYIYGDLGSPHMDDNDEVGALRAALGECWTLCNTLANLSSIHRERVFNSSGKPDAHEKAWKSCWRLCQRLYHSRDEAHEGFSVRYNLELCRDFCQALFGVRKRTNEDPVLRVMFEMNNHLYSAQDPRNLPEAFLERTLDFYITLCHRLMKQRNELAEETDSLLRSCWSLAEMLFSLRQNSREGHAPDVDLLGSAVQACWELCDIFREGWTQIRPDRGTPRPSQMSFHSGPGSGSGSISGAFNGSSSFSAYSHRPPSEAATSSTRPGSRSTVHGPPASAAVIDSIKSSPEQQSSPVMSRNGRSISISGGAGGGINGINGGSTSGSISGNSSIKGNKGKSGSSNSGSDGRNMVEVRMMPPRQIPETPVTEFEDTPISPHSSSPQLPNIMVLGTSSTNNMGIGMSGLNGMGGMGSMGMGMGLGMNVNGMNMGGMSLNSLGMTSLNNNNNNNNNSSSNMNGGPRWPSGASNFSGYSQGSNKTSSTATTTATSAEDQNIARVKMLILKAAMNIGFQRPEENTGAGNGTVDAAGNVKVNGSGDSASASGADASSVSSASASASSKSGKLAPSLQAFVKNLPTGSFGSLPAHATLLKSYKGLVLADKSLRSSHGLPAPGRRVAASDVAKSVAWMVQRSNNQYAFLRELFRLVFGFPLEEADGRKNVTIMV